MRHVRVILSRFWTVTSPFPLGDVSHFFSLSTGQYHNKLSLSLTHTRSKEILLLIYYHIDDFFFPPACRCANTLLHASIKKKPHKTSYLPYREWPHGTPTWRRTRAVGSMLLVIEDASLPPLIDLASLPSSSSRLPLPLPFN